MHRGAGNLAGRGPHPVRPHVLLERRLNCRRPATAPGVSRQTGSAARSPALQRWVSGGAAVPSGLPPRPSAPHPDSPSSTSFRVLRPGSSRLLSWAVPTSTLFSTTCARLPMRRQTAKYRHDCGTTRPPYRAPTSPSQVPRPCGAQRQQRRRPHCRRPRHPLCRAVGMSHAHRAPGHAR